MLDAGPSGRKDAADKARDQGHRDRYRDLRLAAPPTPQPREVRLRFLNVPGVAGGDAHGGEPPLHRLIDGTLRGLFGDGFDFGTGRHAGTDGCGDETWGFIGRAPVGTAPDPDRTSVVSGKSVSVRVDLGGRSIIQIKKVTQRTIHTK